MNFRRRLSRHQARVLTQIGSGELRVRWDAAADHYILSHQGAGHMWLQKSKPRLMSGNHLQNSIVELLQRGLLVDEGGRLVPVRAARRDFGMPPPERIPERHVVMSRTRAARIQLQVPDPTRKEERES